MSGTEPRRIQEFVLDRSLLGAPMVRYACPQCLIALKSPLQDAGQSDACPECSVPFIVPGAEEWAAERARRRERERARQQRQRERRRPSWRDRLKRWRASRTAAARERVPGYTALTIAGHGCLVGSGLTIVIAAIGGLASLLGQTGPIPPLVWLLVLASAFPPLVIAHLLYAFRDLARNAWLIRQSLERNEKRGGMSTHIAGASHDASDRT